MGTVAIMKTNMILTIFVVVFVAIALLFVARMNARQNIIRMIQDGNTDGIRHQIANGVDVNVGWTPPLSKEGEVLPLIEAIHVGRSDIVQMLLTAGAKMDKRDGLGRYPLHVAIARRSPSIIQILINCGASVDAIQPGVGTPLQYAIKHKYIEEIQQLLSNGADPNLIDNTTKLVPLSYAILYGDSDFDIITALLKFGANPATKSGLRNLTAYEYSLQVKNIDARCSRLLYEASNK